MRHEHELIRDLAELLQSRMTSQGHLAQKVVQEGRGNCLPPSKGCTDECKEAQRLVAATAPYRARERPAPRPLKPLPRVVLKPVATSARPARKPPAPAQMRLLEAM